MSPNVCKTFMCCLGHSALFEHVVTHIAEDLKLFFTSESVCILTVLHDLEHVCFGSDHQFERFC